AVPATGPAGGWLMTLLTTEEAERRLGTLHDSSWREAAARRVRRLPDAQRSIAEEILAAAGEDHHGTDRTIAAGGELDALPADQRAVVMTALHPGLGAVLARWWLDARTRPYQGGWSRKAFRTSARYPGLTVRARS